MQYGLLNRPFGFSIVTSLCKFPTEIAVVFGKLSGSSVDSSPIVFRVLLGKAPCIFTAKHKNNSIVLVGAKTATGTGEMAGHAFPPLYLRDLVSER